MSTFVDSSALVKLYVPEDGSEAVGELAPLVISQLARVEVPSALWRAQRSGRVPAAAVGLVIEAFVADYAGVGAEPARFAVVALTDAILADAAALTGSHGLRAYDAVQLASARAAAGADVRVRTFAAFDRTLRDAAAREGFILVP